MEPRRRRIARPGRPRRSSARAIVRRTAAVSKRSPSRRVTRRGLAQVAESARDRPALHPHFASPAEDLADEVPVIVEAAGELEPLRSGSLGPLPLAPAET